MPDRSQNSFLASKVVEKVISVEGVDILCQNDVFEMFQSGLRV